MPDTSELGALERDALALGAPELAPEPNQSAMVQRIQNIMKNASPEELKIEVRSTKKFLDGLRKPLQEASAHANQDAQHWSKHIETLFKREVDTPTIIGVVGNTGAGKSSIINAMLEEERLVSSSAPPTQMHAYICIRSLQIACVLVLQW